MRRSIIAPLFVVLTSSWGCGDHSAQPMDAEAAGDAATADGGAGDGGSDAARSASDASLDGDAFLFESERDVATGYFSWVMMRYGWMSLFSFGDFLSECGECPARTVDGDTTTLDATGGCVATGGLFSLGGSMTRTLVAGGTKYDFSDYFMDLDDGFIGVRATGQAEHYIDESAETFMERIEVPGALSVTQHGPWTPWAERAFPGSPLTITYRSATFARSVFSDHVEDSFQGTVEVPSRGSFRVTGSWVYNRLSECNDDEPWSGELVVEGQNRVVFTFDGETACERRIPYVIDGGRSSAIVLDGIVPVFGPSCG